MDGGMIATGSECDPEHTLSLATHRKPPETRRGVRAPVPRGGRPRTGRGPGVSPRPAPCRYARVAVAGLVAGLVPARAAADAHVERDVQATARERRVGVRHLLADELLDLVALAGRDLEHELVMHLQEHA